MTTEPTPDRGRTEIPAQMPVMDLNDLGVAGTCYSARDCGGKVLNHKDAHNCKNSGGKSWKSSVTGTCYDL